MSVEQWGFWSDVRYSPCEKWRYSLWRTWHKGQPKAAFIGLHPSTHDEKKNDISIRKAVSYCKAWGYGTMIMLNLFAYRASDIETVKLSDDPIGATNDKEIIRMCHRADLIVAYWGANGEFLQRDRKVMRLLREQELEVHCFGTTKNGFPKHPKFLIGDEHPIPYKGRPKNGST